MQKYYNLPEKVRGSLTPEEVDKLLPAELMTRGIVAPPPIVAQNPGPAPKVERKRIWKVMDDKWTCMGFFPTDTAALAFIDLAPLRTDWESSTGTENMYYRPATGLSVEPVDMIDETTFRAFAKALADHRRAKAAYDADKKAFDDANRQVQDVWTELHDDHAQQVAKMAGAAQVLKTFNEYVDICEGKLAPAVKFLWKTFSGEQIDRSLDWLQDEWPEGICVALEEAHVGE